VKTLEIVRFLRKIREKVTEGEEAKSYRDIQFEE